MFLARHEDSKKVDQLGPTASKSIWTEGEILLLVKTTNPPRTKHLQNTG